MYHQPGGMIRSLAVVLLLIGPSQGGTAQTPQTAQTGMSAAERLQKAVGIPFSKQTLTYKTVGQCAIEADVYRTPGDDIRPAVLWIHGGALITGSRSMPALPLKTYLEAGYAIISIDYRLAPETKLDAIIEDLRDAYAWVRRNGLQQFRIDSNRIGVVGHSAGGYLTLMAGFVLKPRPKVLVAFYGYGDVAGEWYSRQDPWYSKQPAVPREEAYADVRGPVVSQGNAPGRRRFYLYCRQQGLWPKEVTGYDPDTQPTAFDRFCPIRNVTKDFPPTILLHGEADTDVPHEQSVSMARVLGEHRIESELLLFRNQGHGFDGRGLKDPDVANAYEHVLSFLAKHLKR